MNLEKLKLRFLPNENNRRLFIPFAAWLIGLLGVGLVFLALHFSIPVLQAVGTVVAFSGILIFVGWVFWFLFHFYFLGGWKKDHDKYVSSLEHKQPWE